MRRLAAAFPRRSVSILLPCRGEHPTIGFRNSCFSQLAWLGPDDGGFQGLNRMLTLIQAGHGIDVEIHTQAVTELIGHQLGINARLPTETGMRTPHDLKGGPVEADGF